MNLLPALLVAIGGYFVGAISFARIVIRIVAPGAPARESTELRLEGSDKTMHLGTVSASSVSAQVGSRYGFLTYLLDMAKIAIPCLLIKEFLPGDYYLVAAAAGTVGHVWPVYYRFKGGRGISAVYGGLVAIDWPGLFVTSLAGMIFGLVLVRDVLTAYLAIVWFIIPWLWFRTQDFSVLLYAVFVNVVVMIAMIPESRQWLKIKREAKWNDTAEVIQLSGMGRGLLKMAKKLGLIKSEREREQHPPDNPQEGNRGS
jgi:glycerol-3-phosphate acyltransferase PlsY